MSLKSIRSLDYVVLLCDDLAAMRRFYEGVLGLVAEEDLGTWVSFRLGAALLTLRPRGPAPAWDDGPSVAGSASVQLAFRVPPPAVETCHEELMAHGVDIVEGPADLPSFGHRTLFFRDPEGNVLEIYAEV